MAGFEAMRHDSDSELAGKLGASLTPTVARPHTPRGQQNSGMFDLHSLYTVQVEQMQTLETPLVLPVPRIAPPLPMHLRARQVTAVDAYEVSLTKRIPRPIGWYAVFVTWLATVTLSAAAATQVPAHVSARMHPRIAAAAAGATTATAAATASATASATATTTAPVTAAATATPSATPKPSPSASSSVPEFVISDLPRVQTKAAAPPHARWVAPPPQIAAAAAVASPKPAPAPAPPPEPVAAAPTAAPVAAHAAPALATPLSTGGTLEDLIRREVAAEQKKVRAAKGQ